MSDSSIRYDSPSDTMSANARKWLEAALFDEREFQKQLEAAKAAHPISFEDAMTMAQAALMVAESCELQAWRPWYLESAKLLLCRAYDTVALQREADRARAGGGLN